MTEKCKNCGHDKEEHKNIQGLKWCESTMCMCGKFKPNHSPMKSLATKPKAKWFKTNHSPQENSSNPLWKCEKCGHYHGVSNHSPYKLSKDTPEGEANSAKSFSSDIPSGTSTLSDKRVGQLYNNEVGKFYYLEKNVKESVQRLMKELKLMMTPKVVDILFKSEFGKDLI